MGLFNGGLPYNPLSAISIPVAKISLIKGG